MREKENFILSIVFHLEIGVILYAFFRIEDDACSIISKPRMSIWNRHPSILLAYISPKCLNLIIISSS